MAIPHNSLFVHEEYWFATVGLIVSASRSPPGLAPKRGRFWSSFSLGSEKGRLLELIFALGGLFGVIFGSFFEPWAHFGSAGGQLFHHKNGLDHQRRPNRHFPQNILIFWVPFWSHFSSIFRFLGLCFWASFFVESRDRFFMDFGFISAQFFHIFFYLSAPLVLVIFDNPSIRKRVSCKSKGIKFSTFSAFFVDFVSSSFFIRFCEIFEAILGSIWHYFSEKNLDLLFSKLNFSFENLVHISTKYWKYFSLQYKTCLLYTSDAADE